METGDEAELRPGWRLGVGAPRTAQGSRAPARPPILGLTGDPGTAFVPRRGALWCGVHASYLRRARSRAPLSAPAPASGSSSSWRPKLDQVFVPTAPTILTFDHLSRVLGQKDSPPPRPAPRPPPPVLQPLLSRLSSPPGRWEQEWNLLILFKVVKL